MYLDCGVTLADFNATHVLISSDTALCNNELGLKNLGLSGIRTLLC